MKNIKSFEQCEQECTCHKRVVICELYDSDGKLLTRQSNRCNPEGGQCQRMHISGSSQKDNYPADSNCNWTHAEIMALASLETFDKPYMAHIYGHSFVCSHCEKALKDAGVKRIDVSPQLPGHEPVVDEGPKGLRYNQGKLQWGLVHFPSLEPMVRVLEYGAKKYAAHNWKGGMPRVEIVECLLRHTYAYLHGEDNDEESGESHLGHILCNAMFLVYGHNNHPHMDNRYKD